MTVEYPKPGSLKQGKDVLQVYQGVVRIPLTISVGPDHKPGRLQVQLTVCSQACNERFCSLPRTDSLKFPLTIK